MYQKSASPSGSSSVSSSSTSSSSTSPSSTTSTSPAATGPTSVQSAGGFTFQGCLTEGTSARALADTNTASDSMTITKCAAFCSSYKYMGVEYSSECYCANSLSAGAVLTTNGCTMTCSGNSTTLCGGPNRLRYESRWRYLKFGSLLTALQLLPSRRQLFLEYLIQLVIIELIVEHILYFIIIDLLNIHESYCNRPGLRPNGRQLYLPGLLQ